MFRLQDNVPEVYIQESRDFQLFCRLYDAVFGGVKFSIDSLQRSTNTMQCDTSLLELLKTKLGLFTELQISDMELRYILSALPIIMQYKGSNLAIKYILNLFQRMSKDTTVTFSHNIINKPSTMGAPDHVIQLTFDQDEVHTQLLTMLLQLVIPTGYTLSFEVIEPINSNTHIGIENTLEVYNITDSQILNDYIDPSEFNHKDNTANELTSAVGLSNITLPKTDSNNT